MVFCIIKKTDPVVNPGLPTCITAILPAQVEGNKSCCCCLPEICTYYFTCSFCDPQPPIHVFGTCECRRSRFTGETVAIHDFYLEYSTIAGSQCRHFLPYEKCTCGTNMTAITWTGISPDCYMPDEPDEVDRISAMMVCCRENEFRDHPIFGTDPYWIIAVIADVGWGQPVELGGDGVKNRGLTQGVWEYPITKFDMEYEEQPKCSAIVGSMSEILATTDVPPLTCQINLQFGLLLSGNAGGAVSALIGDLTVD